MRGRDRGRGKADETRTERLFRSGTQVGAGQVIKLEGKAINYTETAPIILLHKCTSASFTLWVMGVIYKC